MDNLLSNKTNGFPMMEALAISSNRFKSLRSVDVRIVKAIRKQLPWPEIESVREEICFCIAYSFYSAAILLTGSFIELLITVIMIRYRSYNLLDAKARSLTTPNDALLVYNDFIRNKYNKLSFGTKITEAVSVGLLTKEEQITIQNIRKAFRHPFAHGDYDAIIKDVKLEHKDLNTEKNSKNEADNILNVPNLQWTYRGTVAAIQSIAFFLVVDDISFRIINRMKNISQ